MNKSIFTILGLLLMFSYDMRYGNRDIAAKSFKYYHYFSEN